VELEQLIGKSSSWQNVLFDSATGADEKRLDIGRLLLKRVRYRDGWIQVATSSAAGKHDPH
jgi:hypothetical protein